ncbi:MAG TPA: tetratricopeptide repeat protein, partial [Chitinophagaceae bacterium]|nr:tetratricopeptide repeat protein [Chitinophagaceae bacterium]
AIVYFERALNKGYKASSDVVENLSNAYIDAGQPQKGIDLLKQLLEKRPGDLELLRNLGYTHFKLAKYPEAIEYYDKVLYFDKSDAKALYMIGLSYQKKGEKSKGQQLCDKAIQMDPSLNRYRHKKELPSGL